MKDPVETALAGVRAERQALMRERENLISERFDSGRQYVREKERLAAQQLICRSFIPATASTTR